MSQILDKIVDPETGVTAQTEVGGDGVTHSATYPKDPDDTTQIVDAQNNVAVSAAGIETFGVDYLGNEYEEWFVQFDDRGRPVSRVRFDDITLNAKLAPYGDGSYWRQAGFSHDITGHISMSGLVKVVSSTNPIVNGDVIGTIPAEFAPSLAETFIVVSNIGQVRVDVRPTGEIVYSGSASITQYISLSGIRYVAPVH